MTTRPARDPAYIAYVRLLPCLPCSQAGRRQCEPTEAHHIREAGKVAIGRKPSDYRAVPFCRRCHRAWHHGKGRVWLLGVRWREGVEGLVGRPLAGYGPVTAQ